MVSSKNGVEFGTVTFDAAADEGVLDSDADTVFDPEAGDLLEIIEPATPDDTLADVDIAIAAYRL